MAGGAFLCFEGVEKIAHKFLHRHARNQLAQALASGPTDPLAVEREKVKGAIRTDFILSAEIIVITLGTVAQQPFAKQLAVLTGIALLMTAGVYGVVAGIVKIDDAALYLSQRTNTAIQAIGRFLLKLTPWLMRGLSVLGTLAMFLVGGGILIHGVPALGHTLDGWTAQSNAIVGTFGSLLANLGVGLAAGAVVLAAVQTIKRLRNPAS